MRRCGMLLLNMVYILLGPFRAWRLFVLLYIDPLSMSCPVEHIKAVRTEVAAKLFVLGHTRLPLQRWRFALGEIQPFTGLLSHFSCWSEVVSLLPPCYVIAYTIATNRHMSCLNITVNHTQIQYIRARPGCSWVTRLHRRVQSYTSRWHIIHNITYMMLLVQSVVHLWQYLFWVNLVSCWQPLPWSSWY